MIFDRFLTHYEIKVSSNGDWSISLHRPKREPKALISQRLARQIPHTMDGPAPTLQEYGEREARQWIAKRKEEERLREAQRAKAKTIKVY